MKTGSQKKTIRNWQYNGKLDNIRGESMQDKLPELYEAMKKYKVDY